MSLTLLVCPIASMVLGTLVFASRYFVNISGIDERKIHDMKLYAHTYI